MKSYADIYVIDKNTFDQLGQVSIYKGLVFPKSYVGSAKFELYVPITEENKELIKEGRWIYLDEELAGEILKVNSLINDSGEKVLKVSGETLEWLLTTRIIWDTYSANKRPDEIIMDIVDKNCVNPSDSNRVIPNLEIGQIDKSYALPKISHQITGDEVYEDCKLLCETYGIGFGVKLNLKKKKVTLNILYGLDRSINQNDRDYVVISSDMRDIVSSEYINDIKDWKTTALVAGEGEGNQRKRIVSGDNSLSGFDRREMYVDARDIQSEQIEGDLETVLNDRGLEKLSSKSIVKSFQFNLTPDKSSYVLGKDYFVGDIITVIDEEIGVKADVMVSEVEYEWDGDKFAINVTYGMKRLGLLDKVKKMIK